MCVRERARVVILKTSASPSTPHPAVGFALGLFLEIPQLGVGSINGHLALLTFILANDFMR